MPARRPIENVTIGTDPECFIFNTKTNRVKSAVKLIPGTKEHPQSVPELGPGFALQTDNILAEFNVPPVDNVNDFVKNIDLMKDYIRNFVKNIDENYDILCAASQNVPKSELRSKQAKAFGCDPDYCIYTGTVNPRPAAADTTNIRSCGLHIHCGYDNPEIDRSLRLLAYFDAYLGVPAVLMDKDTQRRTLYGKAGCFRLQKWGFEYRSLSAYFMKDDSHLRWVFRQVKRAISAYNNCFSLPDAYLVQEAINENNEELASRLCKDFDLCSDFLD
jgi:hypothetical protein